VLRRRYALRAVHVGSVDPGGAWDVAVWDTGTFAVALGFLVMRRQHGGLGDSPLMFDDRERRVAEERLRERASRDEVTGLANRAAFTDELARCLRRGNTHLALLLLDFDGFKQVNDTLGHAAGDEVLRSAADRLRAAMRPGDLIARLAATSSRSSSAASTASMRPWRPSASWSRCATRSRSRDRGSA
jgi:hypothetical protein